MKNGLKRLVSFLLVLCVVSMFAIGCNQGSGEKISSDITDSSQPEESQTELELQAPFEGLKFNPQEKDFGGQTIQISLWGPVQERGVSAVVDRRLDMWDKAMEKYNIVIEELGTAIYTITEDVITLHSAGLKYSDIMFNPSLYGVLLLKAGVLRPLDGYIDYEHENFFSAGEFSKYIDGKRYSMTGSDEMLGNIIFYNEEILKNEGIEDIMSLYEKGEWTWEKFEEIAIKTTKTAADGTVTQWGVAGSMILNSILASNGVPLVGLDLENNKFQSGLYTEPGNNALSFLRKLVYELKVVDPFTYGGNEGIPLMNQRKATMVLAPAYYGYHFTRAKLPFRTAPLPLGPDIDKPVKLMQYTNWWSITQNSDFSTEDAIMIFLYSNFNDPNDPDIYISEEYEDELNQSILANVDTHGLFRNDQEGKFWFDYLRDRDIRGILDYNPQSAESDLFLVENVFLPLVRGEDPRSHLESIKPLIQEQIDQIMP